MPYKKRASTEAQPILTQRKTWDLGKLSASDYRALAKLCVGCLSKGASAYIQPGRFGSITFKVYLDGDPYAETLNPGDNWDELAEQILDTLFDQETVAKMRMCFETASAEQAAEVPARPKPAPKPTQ